MEKMYKIKSGAIIKKVPEGSLQWYVMANWKVLGEIENDKTNTKKNATK